MQAFTIKELAVRTRVGSSTFENTQLQVQVFFNHTWVKVQVLCVLKKRSQVQVQVFWNVLESKSKYFLSTNKINVGDVMEECSQVKQSIIGKP